MALTPYPSRLSLFQPRAGLAVPSRRAPASASPSGACGLSLLFLPVSDRGLTPWAVFLLKGSCSGPTLPKKSLLSLPVAPLRRFPGDREGISPSASPPATLRNFAGCPGRYFVSRGLRQNRPVPKPAMKLSPFFLWRPSLPRRWRQFHSCL